MEKGRAAKTNFPINTYDEEVIAFEAFTARRCGSPPYLMMHLTRAALGRVVGCMWKGL